MKRFRVVLADDHTLVLEALKNLLEDRLDVVGVASNGRDLIKVARDVQPDVVVTDIAMPGLNGVDACSKLFHYLPDLKIVFLTVSEEPERVAQALKAGARGYVLKRSASSELYDAIQAVAQGKTYVTADVGGAEFAEKVDNGAESPLEQLTPRQREVLQLLAEGHTMKQIAGILHLTPRTVAFHKYRLMDALAVRNNAGLVLCARELGLVA